VLGLDDDAPLDAATLDRVRPFPPSAWRTFEAVYRSAVGPVRSRIVSTIDDQGRLVGLFGLELADTGGDDANRAEVDPLFADTQLVHDILALQPALVTRYTVDGVVVWCNEAYAEHLGLTPDEMIGASWVEQAAVLGFDTRDNLEALLARLFEVTAPGSTTTTVAPMWQDDTSRWIQWTSRRITGPDGDHDLMQGIGVEVTELRSARDALDTLTREVVRGRMSERRELARRLHDDVMQVLVSANWSMAPAADGRVPADSATRSVELVHMAVEHLRSLLEELTAAPVLLGLLADAVSGEAVAMRSAGMDVTVELAEVPGEEVRTVCTRVLVEGMRNAARHSAATDVSVVLRHIDGAVLGEIVDNGVGASSDDLTVALAAGHVGLLMARAMVESIGGSFAVRGNGRSPGTTLTFRIPLRAGREP
jgi:PAS domain S-box-containing protein